MWVVYWSRTLNQSVCAPTLIDLVVKWLHSNHQLMPHHSPHSLQLLRSIICLDIILIWCATKLQADKFVFHSYQLPPQTSRSLSSGPSVCVSVIQSWIDVHTFKTVNSTTYNSSRSPHHMWLGSGLMTWIDALFQLGHREHLGCDTIHSTRTWATSNQSAAIDKLRANCDQNRR
jgi:hypothetical protein